LNIPLAPGRNNLELRRERFISQLEPNLVVAFTRAAVREGVGTLRERNFNLGFSEKGPGN
jgi:hypothetical protein